MYRKSFFIVLLSILAMGLMFTGTRYMAAIPGFFGLPSSYDPRVSIQDAAQTSEKPLLIEFYTDSCGGCQQITPLVHKLSKKYKDDLTFVMVDVNDPEQAQVSEIFGITYVPRLFIFDFKHMAKVSVEPSSHENIRAVDDAIQDGLKRVRKKAAAKAQAS